MTRKQSGKQERRSGDRSDKWSCDGNGLVSIKKRKIAHGT